MVDLAFTDIDGFYYVADVKTHRLDSKFNMPNLTSVERLARFYQEDSNYFAILHVGYAIDNDSVHVHHARLVTIECLSWDGFTIGALGWGQIQIANSNVINVAPQKQPTGMDAGAVCLFDFYPREIEKTKERIE